MAERMEEEVLNNKYKVEESKREAFRGRGGPLEWRRVRKNKKYTIRKGVRRLLARIFSLFREHNLQRLQGKQEELTEEEEMKQQQRMVVMRDLIRKKDQKENGR